MPVWLNGRIVEEEEARIDPRDRGFLLGDQGSGYDLVRRAAVALLRDVGEVVDVERDHTLVGLGVQRDAGHPADHHPGTAHRRPHLQATDVVEPGLQRVRGAAPDVAQVGGLQCQEQQAGDAQQHEHPDQHFNVSSCHRVPFATRLPMPSRRREHQRREDEIQPQHRQ